MNSKRFRIAFSFAGEKRDFVEQVADILARRFGETAILYDKYHEAEFARHDLGIYLPKLYGEQSDLIIPVLCPNYDVKRWTGWEWLHIYGLLTKGDGRRVMPARFGYANADGLSPAAGFIELDDKTPDYLATRILERLALNEGRPKDYYTKALSPGGAVTSLGADGSAFGGPGTPTSEAESYVDYEYHIFLSYAHGKIWSPWVKETFVPKLEAYLELEVGPVVISVDYQIQPGAEWSPNLERRVARSKLMLPLLTANYFHRKWCVRELALMFERERAIGLEGTGDNYGLLIPIRLGDGLTFPDLITRVQYLDFEQFADPDLPSGSPRAAEFNRKLRELAVVIARTLPKLPDLCSDEWKNFTGANFIEQLRPKPLPSPAPSRLLV